MNPQKNPPHYKPTAGTGSPLVLLVPPECAGLRLDQALARLLPEFSRSRLQQWVRGGHVSVDGRRVNAKTKLWGGESVNVSPQADVLTRACAAEDIPFPVVYEDEAIIVVDKPAGLVVHPGSGNWSGTLLNALLHHAPQLAALPRAGIVHRLDKDTSGLLVVAKTLTAQTDLVRQLQARTVGREYFALVHGSVARSGSVEAPIGRHPLQRTRMAIVGKGKPATTRFEPLEHGPGWSLLRCRLETGRTHQIRVHLSSIGHPLIGDPAYRSHRAFSAHLAAAGHFPRQALHAARLILVHPLTGHLMQWESPMPADMRELLSRLRRD